MVKWRGGNGRGVSSASRVALVLAILAAGCDPANIPIGSNLGGAASGGLTTTSTEPTTSSQRLSLTNRRSSRAWRVAGLSSWVSHHCRARPCGALRGCGVAPLRQA